MCSTLSTSHLKFRWSIRCFQCGDIESKLSSGVGTSHLHRTIEESVNHQKSGKVVRNQLGEVDHILGKQEVVADSALFGCTELLEAEQNA